MKIVTVDVETTGLDAENGSIVELAIVSLPSFTYFSSLVKPEHPIELQAMATHHILEEEVADADPFEKVIADSMIEEADYIAAHNAAFDMSFLRIDKPVICTWRCARHLYPDCPSHSNQVLRYYLKLNDKIQSDKDGKKIMKLPPHRALPDAWVTAHILNVMLETKTPEELVALTKKPILLKMCNFGKHRGTEWENVPRDYMAWMLRQKPGFDPDTTFTIKHHLGVV